MPKPGEHKTVQARILAYAEAIGWTFVSREEAERRRGMARARAVRTNVPLCYIWSPECDKKRPLTTNKGPNMSLMLL